MQLLKGFKVLLIQRPGCFFSLLMGWHSSVGADSYLDLVDEVSFILQMTKDARCELSEFCSDGCIACNENKAVSFGFGDIERVFQTRRQSLHDQCLQCQILHCSRNDIGRLSLAAKPLDGMIRARGACWTAKA